MMTLLKREMFTGGTLTSASPGPNFAAVSGTLVPLSGGPMLSGGTAMSVDPRARDLGANIYINGKFLADGQMKVAAGGWYFFKEIENSPNRSGSLLSLMASTDPVIQISVSSQTLVFEAVYRDPTITWFPFIPKDQWVYLMIAARNSTPLAPGNVWDARAYYKLIGGPFIQWAAFTGVDLATGGFHQAQYGVHWNNPSWNGRFGASALYSFTSDDFSDLAYPADTLEPSGRYTYYLNPATGNDINDGMTPATAWKNAAKINDASYFCTLLPALSYASGSTLVIDTSSAPLDITGGVLRFQTRGLTVVGATNERFNLQAAKRILGNEWTFLGSGVYTTTNTVTDCVLWEDSKWMNHPVGTTYASVQASMQSTPGSFWTDGTTLYCHPFGNTDPRSDGKTYQRSCFGSTGPAVFLSVPDMDFCGAVVSMICDVQNDGNSQGGYGIQSEGSFGGVSRLRKCLITYGGKHGIGFTNDTSNSDLTIEDCQVEQCSPYSGNSPWVSYIGGDTMSGNVHRYVRCTTLKCNGLIGSTTGTVSFGAVWLCHNNGVGNQISSFELTDCNFPLGSIEAGMTPTVFAITGGTFGRVACYAPVVKIDRVKFDSLGVQCVNDTGNVTVTNCIFQQTVGYSGGNEGFQLRGTIAFKGCTIDMRQIPAGNDWPYSALWLPEQYNPKYVALTFVNNIVISDGRFGVFRNGLDTDPLTIHHNAYCGMGRIAIFYNPGTPGQATYDTLAQWQAATPHDDNSIAPADLMLDANYKPLAGSPVVNAGSDLGKTSDYSGAIFSPRNDIGAYEFGPPWVPTPEPPDGGGGGDFGYGVHNLLYTIAQNTAGIAPAFGDDNYDLAWKIVQNTAGTAPRPGDRTYDLYYKIAGNTAGIPPKPGDRIYDLLFKIAGNTGGSPLVGDGIPDLLVKTVESTE